MGNFYNAKGITDKAATMYADVIIRAASFMKKNNGNVQNIDQILPSTSTSTVQSNNSFTTFSSCLTKMVTDSKKYKDDGYIDLAISTWQSVH